MSTDDDVYDKPLPPLPHSGNSTSSTNSVRSTGELKKI
jgi:hypothetical protein